MEAGEKRGGNALDDLLSMAADNVGAYTIPILLPSFLTGGPLLAVGSNISGLKKEEIQFLSLLCGQT